MADRTYVTKRVRFFDHQFLRVDEFADEQAYHIARRRDHNRGFHTPGVVEGLEVVWTNTAAELLIDVEPGWATDDEGRELVLGTRREELDIAPAGGDADVW